MLPIGHTRLDKDFQRVDADNLTKRVFEKLFLTPVVGLNPPKSPFKRGILYSLSVTNLTFQTASKAQVQALPEFTGDMQIDYDHEEQVRGVYRSSAPNMQQTAGVGSVGADSAPATKNTSQQQGLNRDRDRN